MCIVQTHTVFIQNLRLNILNEELSINVVYVYAIMSPYKMFLDLSMSLNLNLTRI